MSLALRRRAMKPPAAAGVTDSFNRANSTTSLGSADTGQAWSVLAGTWGIDANRAYAPNAEANDRQVVVDAGQADATVAVDLVVLDPIGGPGLTFRAVDASNYWLFVAEPESTRWALYKRVAGSYTLVGSAAQAPTTGRLSVVLSGASITAKLDGTTLISATDSAHQTATRHGLRDYRFNAASNNRLDNFSVAA